MNDWHRILLFLILCLFGLCAVQSKQPIRRKGHRSHPKDNRVYLVHADVLHYDRMVNAEAQILNGHVSFRHNGARLLCDSAYFFETSNSFEAFGHVRMYQGDTLSLFSDYAFYNGNEEMAEARHNVVLKHRKSVLYTDSLNYDRLYNIGYFFEGGKMVDNGSVLTSDWGEYNTETRQAVFNYSVKLRNKKFTLTTDTLYYDTQTDLARIVGPSDIVSGKSHIFSKRGTYDTRRDRARLMDRSVIKNGGKEIVGDSVYYDSQKGISKAFRNIIYTDKVNKNKLTGNYCLYNEKTGYAEATDSALAYDYSQKDTLYLHADTFKVFTYHINTDSVYRKIHAYNRVRAFRTDVQAVCDSLVYNSLDSCLTMYRDPIVWNNNQQLTGEEIRIYMKDSTVDRAHVVGQAFSVEEMFDKLHYNQISSSEMRAFFTHGDITMAEASNNVNALYYPIDDSDSSLIGANYTETNLLRMFIKDRKMQKIWTSQGSGVIYPLTQIPPDKHALAGFAWFDYIRPIDKMDVFNWRSKRKGTELKPQKHREAPLKRINN